MNLGIGFWCMRLKVSSSDGGVHLLWCLVTSGNLTFSELTIGPDLVVPDSSSGSPRVAARNTGI